MKLALALSLLALAGPLAPPDEKDDGFERWFSAVLPAEEELAFREIPWRPSFWDGVVEAQEQDRPILLWAMNGHPLGCT